MNRQPPHGFKTRRQIASEYGCSIQTLRSKLKKHGIELPPGLISLRWQKVIYEELGYPPGISRSDYRDDQQFLSVFTAFCQLLPVQMAHLCGVAGHQEFAGAQIFTLTDYHESNIADMKTPSRLILFALLFSLAFGCNKDTLLFQNKGTPSFLPSGKGSALGAEKSLFSADSNYIALFEEYKGAFIDFLDSMIQNHGLPALQISLMTFNDCIAQNSTDMNCFSFISNLADSTAVNDYFSATATHLSALRADYNSLSDTEFNETLELSISNSVSDHFTANPLTALVSLEQMAGNTISSAPGCYMQYAADVEDANIQLGITLVGCAVVAPQVFAGCAIVAGGIYDAQLYNAAVDFDNCLCINYNHRC